MIIYLLLSGIAPLLAGCAPGDVAVIRVLLNCRGQYP